MSDAEDNSGLIIGISVGVATAALVGILIGIAVVCQRKLKQKDIEEEKRQLDDDSGSVSGTDPIGGNSRNKFTQTPETKGTQTPIPVHVTPRSALGVSYGFGMKRSHPASADVHPITGLPRLPAQGKQNKPQALQPSDVVKISNVESRQQHETVNDLVRPHDRECQDRTPELDRTQNSARGHDMSPQSGTSLKPSQPKLAANMDGDNPGKRDSAVDLQKNYPTMPIPKLHFTDSMDSERLEQYVGNWLDENVSTSTATDGRGGSYIRDKGGYPDVKSKTEAYRGPYAGRDANASAVVNNGAAQKQHTGRHPVHGTRYQNVTIPGRPEAEQHSFRYNF